MSKEKNIVDPALAGFYKAMEKTNTEKITNEILAGLSEDSGDSDDFDVEIGNEDAEDRPWRPSHTIFGKSSIKKSQIDAMKGRYFCDMSIVSVGGDNAAPAPEEDEVVVYRSFMKAGLRFPLSRFLVEVLKTFEIFLHQITPEAIIRMSIFVWAVRSQGLKPSVKCFYNMHELLYETKATGKEQYHNNFGCYGFVYPDYTYPSRKQGKKRKTAASAISVVPKGKKVKVLTHRQRYIETTIVPKLGEGTSSTAEVEQAAPAGRSVEESAAVPKVSATGSTKVPIQTAEVEGKMARSQTERKRQDHRSQNC
jgi:hypothetical protein